MNKATTLTLKIINDEDMLDSFPKAKALTEEQKELIRFITREAVRECIREMQAAPQASNRDRILRIREVQQITGLSRSGVYKHVNEGVFPKPISLGNRSVGWKESQIGAWIEERPKR